MCWSVINSVHLTLCFYCSWQLEELTNVALHRGYRAPWTRSEKSCFCSGSWSVWTAVRKSRAVCTTLALARGVPASPDPDPDHRGGHVVDSDPDPDPRGGHLTQAYLEGTWSMLLPELDRRPLARKSRGVLEGGGELDTRRRTPS